MKTSISTGGVRKFTQQEKDILAHPGSRAFALYFSIMCIGGFIYFLIKGPFEFAMAVGLAGLAGIALAIIGLCAAAKQEKVIEFDPAFEAVEPAMQQHINELQTKDHRDLMKKVHLLMPFLLLLFASPFIGTVVLIDVLDGLGGGSRINVVKLIVACACFAYFIGFIIVGLIIGVTAGKRQKRIPENQTPIHAEGIVYSCMLASEGTGGKTYRIQIAVYEHDHFLVALSKNFYARGEKIKVEYIKEMPSKCNIINESL